MIPSSAKFEDYYFGYKGIDDKIHPGYVDMIESLENQFPLFGAILRMRNLLSAFDEFAGKELISERDLQDYLGRYQDLRDEWNEKRKKGESVDIVDDIVFEVELIKQIEINIDYILILVKKYHDTHCTDKEVLVTIQKAIDASPELRSKKALIETFISGINNVEDSICCGYTAGRIFPIDIYTGCIGQKSACIPAGEDRD